MTEEYTKLPYIGKKRAKKLAEAGIGIEEIAKMDETELKKHIPRISSGKLKVIIATAREIAGRMYDIMDAIGLEKDQAKKLALEGYDLQKIAKAKKEDISRILGIPEKDAFNIIFRAALKTGVKKAEVKVKKEEINHTGIISQEGFVNGFGGFKIREEEKKTFKLLPFLIILLLGVSIVYGVFYFQAPSFRIDGSFEEWKSVGGYTLENTTYKYKYISGSLFFYIHENGMFNLPEGYYVLIDNGESRGYLADGLKATYVAEFYGWNGTLKGARLWKYSNGDYLWNFTPATGMVYANNRGDVEFLLNHISPDAKVMFLKKSNGEIRSPQLYVDEPTAQVRIRTMHDVIKDGEYALEISIESPLEFTLEKMTIYSKGAYIKNATLNTKNAAYVAQGTNEYVEFKINKKIKNDVFLFAANYSGAPGTAISFKVVLESRDVKFGYVYETSKVYLYSPPSGIIIDGAFGDWKDRMMDSVLDVKDANIDLVNYSYTPNLEKVYFEVRGEFMGGDDVPIVRKWMPKDSDRDGVPDKYDPYPHDFNNDGVPDKDSNGDVDGDGYIDYPAGNDTWLNTTIPYDFPSPYAGKHVSVYIGPPPPVKPKNGNDTAEIYFGGNSAGAHLSWVPFPVEYKITISGRCGIYVAKMYKFKSGNWIYVGRIKSIASGYHAMELSTGLSIEKGKVWITIFNWERDYDSSNMALRTTRATYGNTFHLHADNNGKPSNMDWIQGSNDQTLRLITEWGTSNKWYKDYAEWYYQYNLAGDLIISSAVVTLQVNGKDDNNGQDFLNISVYAYTQDNNKKLIAYTNKSLQNDINQGTNVLQLDIVGDGTAPKGSVFLLNFTFISDLWGSGEDYIDIKYNGSDVTSDDTFLSIISKTGITVDEIYTENNTQETEYFAKGDTVHVFANVTDPLGSSHIDGATLDVKDPLGSTLISGSTMSVVDEGEGYKLFEFSFSLDGVNYGSGTYAFTGVYPISVTAKDKEGNTATNSSEYYVDSHVDIMWNRYLFVPTGDYKAWFLEIIKNQGDGDEIVNFEMAEGHTPNYDTIIYLDSDGNKIPSSSDPVLARYTPGSGWTYVNSDYDFDGDGNPDIVVNEGSSKRIVIQENLSLANVGDKESFTIIANSSTGHFAGATQPEDRVTDTSEARTYEIKTLYLLGDGSTTNNLLNTTSPSGTSDVYVNVNGATATWSMNTPFANDLVLATDIYVKIYVENTKFRSTSGNITLYLDDGTLVGYSDFTIGGSWSSQWYTLAISPKLSKIPRGSYLKMNFTSPGNVNVHFNSTDYPSRIEINTTSYIWTGMADTYNYSTDEEQSEFRAGETVVVRTYVKDPFGAYDIAKVYMNVTDPKGNTISKYMELEDDYGWIQKYMAYYTIPTDGYVGIYTAKITAIETNGVKNSTTVTFKVACNISISPHDNESYGTDVWYNHTIWNNGSGVDIVTVLVSSNASVNITLYLWDGSSWKTVAYSNTGTGWDWVDSNYDVDGDGNPDFTINRGESIKIAVEVKADTNVKTTMEINDSLLGDCYDSAVDTTTVPELNTVMILPILLVILIGMLFKNERERHKY